MGRLDDKVAIVTGSGSGIGKAIARSLAAAGAKIVLAGRTVERLVVSAQEIEASGATAVPIATDVTD
jgi:NADP-dependent 3-hydroxy acid dehydrogenase YdfG